MLGQPLFPGESGIDQLVEIIKVLGTPTRDQIKTMNPNVRLLCAARRKGTDRNNSTWDTSFLKSSPIHSQRFSDPVHLRMLLL